MLRQADASATVVTPPTQPIRLPVAPLRAPALTIRARPSHHEKPQDTSATLVSRCTGCSSASSTLAAAQGMGHLLPVSPQAACDHPVSIAMATRLPDARAPCAAAQLLGLRPGIAPARATRPRQQPALRRARCPLGFALRQASARASNS